MTITEFISARLDEDERVARAAAVFIDTNGEDDEDPGDAWETNGVHVGTAIGSYHIATAEDSMHAHGPELAEHIARHDPARVLREIEAKRLVLGYADWARRIFEEDERRESTGAVVHDAGYRMGQWHGYKAVLSALASAYSDHPDFQPEWSA